MNINRRHDREEIDAISSLKTDTNPDEERHRNISVPSPQSLEIIDDTYDLMIDWPTAERGDLDDER